MALAATNGCPRNVSAFDTSEVLKGGAKSVKTFQIGGAV